MNLVEGPPLWIWALVIAAVIAGKLTLRWSILRKLAQMLRTR